MNKCILIWMMGKVLVMMLQDKDNQPSTPTLTIHSSTYPVDVVFVTNDFPHAEEYSSALTMKE